MGTAADLRAFVDVLERSGDLVRVDREVHWDLELSAVGRRACEVDGPALLFNRITDYPGWRVLANPIATWRRMALALGLEASTPVPRIYQVYEEREAHPIPPRVVGDAPCKAHVVTGEKVDLFDLPAPMVHEEDGGRYLATWALVVSRDPDTGWVNWGTYRFMVHDRRLLAGFPRPTSHLGKVLQERYVPRGQPMPVAIAIGADPCSHVAAAATYRLEGEEAALAGGLAGRPIELVRCETQNLLVPASAEVVIEGEILPDRIAQEGPYGEYPGYRTGEMGRGVLMRVTAITYRDDPILTLDATGFKDCSSIVTSLSGAVAIRRRLERHGVPVTAVYVPPEGAVHLAVVAVRRGGREVARQVLEVLTARRALLSKIIVVDDDVDVFNMAAVVHALATKCHPGRGILVAAYEGRANTLTPCYDHAERARQAGATAVFDATWPPEWDPDEVPVRATFDTIYPEELRRKVEACWAEYGLASR